MGLGYLDVSKIIYESIRSAITTKKNDVLSFSLMIIAFCRMNQVNMASLDINVLLEKTIIDDVIERYSRINGYEDTKDEREMAKITGRETEQRRKIRDDMKRILDKMSKARNDLNVERPGQEYYLYDPAVSYRSQRIDTVEDDDNATS
ncbi:hypothetical protein Syun_023280 [Stephania yunnanensis]|uniref:Uncharacterized protein n=1 Tax=Stephania yunnanensis TaxID=152371 RepID=A0AAP0F9D5_9MAGN